MKETIDFIEDLDKDLSYREYINEIERRLLIKSLERFECNISMTARWLGFNSRTALVERMKRFGIVKKSILKGEQHES